MPTIATISRLISVGNTQIGLREYIPAIALSIVRGAAATAIYGVCHIILAEWHGQAAAAQAFAALTKERWHQGASSISKYA